MYVQAVNLLTEFGALRDNLLAFTEMNQVQILKRLSLEAEDLQQNPNEHSKPTYPWSLPS